MDKATFLTTVITLLLFQSPSFSNTPSIKGSRPFGTPPKSWCIGIIDQWKFRVQHFGRDDRSIRAMFEESNCRYWGLTFPRSNSPQPGPNHRVNTTPATSPKY